MSIRRGLVGYTRNVEYNTAVNRNEYDLLKTYKVISKLSRKKQNKKTPKCITDLYSMLLFKKLKYNLHS